MISVYSVVNCFFLDKSIRLQVPAEPRFGTKPVKEVRHDTEPGEGEDYCCRSDEAGKVKPIETVEPRK